MLLRIMGNMLNLRLFVIIVANVEATILAGTTEKTTSVNFKLLSTGTTASNSNNKIEEEAFIKFLNFIYQEEHFKTIVILTNWLNNHRKDRDYCLDIKYYVDYVKLQQHVPIPVLLLQPQQQDYILHSKFHSEFLTIICIPPLDPSPNQQLITQNQLLSALSKNLWYLRQNRVVIRINFLAHNNQGHLKNVVDILKYCNMEQILNVIVISYQFPYNDLDYYSYSKFPKFKIRKRKWIMGKTKIFPNQLLDIKGYTLRTIADQYEPASMIYYDQQGHQQMSGYIGHFVKYFAKSINASLAFAFEAKVGETIFFTHILNFTRNNTIDLAASIVGPMEDTDWSEYSYPLESGSYCVMLPVEAELSSAEIFFTIMSPTFITILILLCLCFTFLLVVGIKRICGPLYRFHWVDLLINDKAFRAVLGQGFPFCKHSLDYFVAYVLLLLFITGLMVVTLYGVFLHAYTTSPPKKPAIKSFNDLDKSAIKILINREEYNLINPSEYIQYRNLFHIVSRGNYFKEFKRLNTSYAYPVSTVLWSVKVVQQKRFSRPLFRCPEDICFTRYMHFYQLLPLHSVFRESLHNAILKVYASGLYYHWLDSVFYELVSLGRMAFADLTQPREVMPITVTDLKIIFVGVFISLLCSIGVFVIELFVSFWETYTQKNLTVEVFLKEL